MVQGVDYRIPMSVKTVDLGAVGQAYLQGEQNNRKNALLEITQGQDVRAQETHERQMQHLDDEARAKSIGGFALEIMPFLERGDIAGAQRAYSNRVQEVKSRGGNPSDSMELGPYLMSGDLEGAKQLVGDTIGALERRGYLKPASKAEGFTLSKDQIRFDANGNEIASNVMPDLVSDLEKEKTIFDRASKLRGEYNKQSSDFFKVRDAYDRIQASIEKPDAAGDLSLIFNYMKMLDPGSTVREGEFATAQNAGGVDATVKNLYNRLMNGERLQPEQREMFAGRAGKLFNTAKARNSNVKGDILSIANRFGLAEEDLFGSGNGNQSIDDLVNKYAY